MTINKIHTYVLSFFFMLIMCGMLYAESKENATLMVFPARKSIVQLAFDFARLEPVTLVTYNSESDISEPSLYIWKKSLNNWVKIDMDDYRSASLFQPKPSEVIILGNDDRILSTMKQASQWCQNVKVISKLDIVTVVNKVNESLNFSPRGWKWLAKRHELEISDLNAERRRYGKYGKPGETKVPEETAPMPKTEQEPIVIPPVTSTSTAQPVQKETVAPIAEQEKGLDNQSASKVIFESPGETQPEDK